MIKVDSMKGPHISVPYHQATTKRLFSVWDVQYPLVENLAPLFSYSIDCLNFVSKSYFMLVLSQTKSLRTITCRTSPDAYYSLWPFQEIWMGCHSERCQLFLLIIWHREDITLHKKWILPFSPLLTRHNYHII